MRKSWTCALSISTVAHCVTPSRVKPFATIAVAADKVDALKSLVNTYQDILKNELAEKEKNLALLLDSVANDKAALIAKSRYNFIFVC